MICRVFVNVFDALVHVSECRRKSASTAVGERVTETTGISLWEKVVTRLRRFALPRVSCALAGDGIARAISGMWAGRSQGVCGNPPDLGGAPVGLKKADLPCHAMPCQPAWGASAVRGQQQYVTHLFNVGRMMHHSPARTIFGGR